MAQQQRRLTYVAIPLIVFLAMLVATVLAVVRISSVPILSVVDAPFHDFLIRVRNLVQDPAQRPISKDIVVVGVDDATSLKLGVYGRGVWWYRGPFTEQLSRYRQIYRPAVVCYDFLFPPALGSAAGSSEGISRDHPVMGEIGSAVAGLAAGKLNYLPDHVLLNTIKLVIDQGDTIMAQALAYQGSLADGGTDVIFAFKFDEDARKEWSREAILGSDPANLGEDNGLQLPYLRDVAIPAEFVHPGATDYQWWQRADLPIPGFLDAVRLAFINVPRDPDGTVRRVPLVIGMRYHFPDPATGTLQERTLWVPSLSLAGCLNFWGIDLRQRHQDQNYLVNGEPLLEIHLGDRIVVRRPAGGPPVEIPIDDQGRLLIDYVAKLQEYQNVPFYATLSKDLKDRLLPLLHRKLVFQGLTGTGITDVGPTPVDPNTPFVHVHVSAANNILTGTFIRPVGPLVTVLILAGLWLLITPLALFLRPIRFMNVVILLILGYVGATFALVYAHQYQLPFFGPMIFLVAAFLGIALFYYFTEEREKKKIRNMFSTMVSGEVLAYMEDHPTSFSLAGERREATMMFSDVAGFTTISESLPADRLVELLNRYLSPMTEIIQSTHGYVDKYEGDAIMAEWGVPYPREDHAVQACLAALAQQERLEELRPALKKEFGHELRVRMGINSGVVSAGNMGSQRRFSYTVMGDAVNQAARYEPSNKVYGTYIMIGETTYELAKDAIEARLLDLLQVKGKTKPIRVYELLGRKGQVEPGKLRVAELYRQALEVHWQRRWDEAIALFRQALELDPDDAPSRTMLRRVEGYREAPPAEGWQGEYVRESKD